MMLKTILAFLFTVSNCSNYKKLLPELKKEVLTEYLDESQQLKARSISNKLNQECNDPVRKAFDGFHKIKQILQDQANIYDTDISDKTMTEIADIHYSLQNNKWYCRKIINFVAEKLIQEETFIDLYHGQIHELLLLFLNNPTDEMTKALYSDKIRLRNYILVWGVSQSLRSKAMANILRLFYEATNANNPHIAHLDILWQNASFEDYIDAYTTFNDEIFTARPLRLVNLNTRRYPELKFRFMWNFLTQLLMNNDYDFSQFKDNPSGNDQFKQFDEFVASLHYYASDKPSFNMNKLYQLLVKSNGGFILWDLHWSL